MPDSKLSEYLIKMMWVCLFIVLITINASYFLSKYRPSSLKKTIPESLEDKHDYKSILDLQSAFIRNTKRSTIMSHGDSALIDHMLPYNK